MKKNYIAPEAALVNYAAESMLALSLDYKDGSDTSVGSNVRFEEDWDEE
ncbi:MAG: hypothetical protein Q4D23_06355 [Bacteroidales bacterium]|nr:hypothetical protein [Bacteroidales bacterium]